MNITSKYTAVGVIVMWMSIMYACTSTPPTNLTEHQIIPHPVEIIATGGRFDLNRQIKIVATTKELNDIAGFLSQAIGVSLDGTEQEHGAVILAIDRTTTPDHAEAYILEIKEEQIRITASEPQGVFLGVQSLLQLIPYDSDITSFIPTGNIIDYPRYSYRGSMLDVSRHFFAVEDVKRYIDFLASYKMNVLHLHLTDDQGWRIEIKSRPKLTEIGATSEVGDGKGGYYTQEQFKEIVDYAAGKYITIIPEIDMPGHTQAALASYPELNCDGQPRELYRGTEVGFSTLCTRSEVTYEFVDEVIGELAAITPGPYIHIGGDESHVTKPEDYVYFIERIQAIVSKHGKTMIGWDEVARGDIASTSIVQQWNSAGNAQFAADKGLKIIMSPATRAYLDMKYDSTTRLGLAWASLIEVDHGYLWDPDTINLLQEDAILGIEAPLWTETIESMDDIEYMVFPRIAGYAEIGWSPQHVRSWPSYRQRLAAHGRIFEREQINFYRSPLVDWVMKNKPTALKN